MMYAPYFSLIILQPVELADLDRVESFFGSRLRFSGWLSFATIDGLQRETHALAFWLKTDDLGGNALTGADQLFGRLRRGITHLGDVQQCFDAVVKLNECTERDHARHQPLDRLADAVILLDLFPGIRLEALQA